jgi:hypothetical protein
VLASTRKIIEDLLYRVRSMEAARPLDSPREAESRDFAARDR